MIESQKEAESASQAEVGLTAEEYAALMRKHIYQQWLNETISDRGLREKYSEWVQKVFECQLVATNVIVLLCVFTGSTVPAVVAGCLTGITGLVNLVVKYLFSAKKLSALIEGDLTKVTTTQRNTGETEV